MTLDTLNCVIPLQIIWCKIYQLILPERFTLLVLTEKFNGIIKAKANRFICSFCTSLTKLQWWIYSARLLENNQSTILGPIADSFYYYDSLKIIPEGTYDQPVELATKKLIQKVSDPTIAYSDNVAHKGCPKYDEIRDVQANTSYTKSFLTIRW